MSQARPPFSVQAGVRVGRQECGGHLTMAVVFLVAIAAITFTALYLLSIA